jgi:hypothetical protein
MGILSFFRRTQPSAPSRPSLIDPRRMGLRDVAAMVTKLRPPTRLQPTTAETMLLDPTIFACLRARWAIAQSADYHFECSEDEDAQEYGQQALDELLPQLLPHALMSMVYGETLSQIVWDSESRTITTWKPSGKRRSRFPAVFFPRQFRPWEPQTWTLRVDNATGDISGARYSGGEWSPEQLVLFVHQQKFARFYGTSALLPQWRPWQVEFRTFDDLGLYSELKAAPPLKVRAPTRTEWKSVNKGDVASTGIEEPLEWIRDVAANVYSNGGMALPSTRRLGDQGQDLGYMFEVEQLALAERGAEYERILSFLRMLKLEGGLSFVAEGQAASKQMSRQQFGMVYPDHLEISQQMHDQVVRPCVELAWRSSKVPKTRIVPGQPAENRRELLVDLLKNFKDARIRLEQGGEVPVPDMVDWMRALHQLSVPALDPDRMTPREKPPAPFAGPNGRPEQDPGDKPFVSDEPDQEVRGAG